jgi:hypothetical protein
MHREVPYTEFLERRFDFAAWKGAPAAPERREGVAISAFTGDELPGWLLQRTTCCSHPDGPMVARGFWVGAESAATVLDVEVFECEGPRAARSWLLTLLGDMQGLTIEREEGASFGDVGFRAGGDRALVFARLNVVVRIRNTGDVVACPLDAARLVDAWLCDAARRAMPAATLPH